MKITVNGEEKEIESGLNLSEVLDRLITLDHKIAVELNKNVIRKKDWETTEVLDSDKLEIVHFVGGG